MNILNIYVLVEELTDGCLVLMAEVDKQTAQKQLEYQQSLTSNKVRLSEIELTDKRISYKS